MLKSFGSVILLCLVSSAASADIITFETAPLGPSSSFVLGGVTFSAVGGSGAIIRATNPNGTQGIIDNNATRLELRADFSSLQNFVSVDLGDFNADPDLLVLRAFNSANVLLGLSSIPIDGSFTGMLTLSVTVPNIAYVTFGSEAPSLGGSSVYADNLTFNTAVNTAPEPGSLALVATGMTAFGLVRRRRRRKTAGAEG